MQCGGGKSGECPSPKNRVPDGFRGMGKRNNPH